ncbi:MAG TPA: hypothetical protein VFQ63_03075 [Patescibacteria group bacterium]|nr:hypothetical protein [Patescibacteria group bacterium]
MKDERSLILRENTPSVPSLSGRRLFPEKATREQSALNAAIFIGTYVPQLTQYLRFHLTDGQFAKDVRRADLGGLTPSDHTFIARIKEELHGPRTLRRILRRKNREKEKRTEMKDKLLGRDLHSIEDRIADTIDAVAYMRQLEQRTQHGNDSQAAIDLLQTNALSANILASLSLPTANKEKYAITQRMLTAMLLTRANIAQVMQHPESFSQNIESLLKDAKENGTLHTLDDAQELLVHTFLYGFSPSTKQTAIFTALKQARLATPSPRPIEDTRQIIEGIEGRVVDAE